MWKAPFKHSWVHYKQELTNLKSGKSFLVGLSASQVSSPHLHCICLSTKFGSRAAQHLSCTMHCCWKVFLCAIKVWLKCQITTVFCNHFSGSSLSGVISQFQALIWLVNVQFNRSVSQFLFRQYVSLYPKYHFDWRISLIWFVYIYIISLCAIIY